MRIWFSIRNLSEPHVSLSQCLVDIVFRFVQMDWTGSFTIFRPMVYAIYKISSCTKEASRIENTASPRREGKSDGGRYRYIARMLTLGFQNTRKGSKPTDPH